MTGSRGGDPRQTVERTVLFVDVCDSTRLFDDLGDEEARGAILGSLDRARRAVEAAGGVVIERAGDELLCLFEGARAAARAAAGIHDALEVARAAGGVPSTLSVRIGFHAGPVVRDGAGVFGRTVHEAHRVAARAKGGQVVTTAETARRLDPLDVTLRWLERAALRGLPGPVELYEVLVGGDATVEVPERLRALIDANAAATRELVLRAGDTAVVLGSGTGSSTVGRGSDCDLVVEHTGVSRLHARVERRGDDFVLVDLSTNGSLVLPAGGPAVFVRRREEVLRGHGRIALGPDAAGPDAALDYAVRDAAP